MSRRFHTLKAALKYLRPPGATPGVAVPDAPADTQLKHFQDYLAGKIIIKIVRADDSLPGLEKFCSLKAFGDTAAETIKYLVNISGRALISIGTTGLSVDDLGIDTTPAGNVGLEKVKGFVPAKVTIANIPSGKGTDTQSKISGDEYKKKATKTYTYPFGVTTTHPNYKAVKGAILAKVKAGTTNHTVSFHPEKI